MRVSRNSYTTNRITLIACSVRNLIRAFIRRSILTREQVESSDEQSNKWTALFREKGTLAGLGCKGPPGLRYPAKYIRQLAAHALQTVACSSSERFASETSRKSGSGSNHEWEQMQCTLQEFLTAGSNLLRRPLLVWSCLSKLNQESWWYNYYKWCPLHKF